MPPRETTLEWLDYGFMAAGGLVLIVFALRAWGKGDPLRGSPLRPNRLTPLHVWFCAVVYFLMPALGASLAGAAAPPDLKNDSLKLWLGLFGVNFTQVILIGVCLLLARAVFLRGVRTFGLGRRPIHRDIAVAVAGWLAATCVCGLMLLAIDRLLQWFKVTPPEHGVFVALRDPALHTWMRVIAVAGALILAPIAEELFFRGVLQTGFRKIMPPRWGSLRHRWVPIAVTAIIFGALHSATPHHVPPLIALGLLLGFLYERYGSLLAPILVHVLFNGKSLLWYYLKP